MSDYRIVTIKKEPIDPSSNPVMVKYANLNIKQEPCERNIATVKSEYDENLNIKQEPYVSSERRENINFTKDQTSAGVPPTKKRRTNKSKREIWYKELLKQLLDSSGRQKRKKFGEFSCEKCQKVFGKKSALRQHRKSHRTPNESCKICLKTFTTLQGLQAHLQTHQEQCEHFVCPVCDKCFKTKQSLSMHWLDKEQPYRCSVCDKRFDIINTLAVHKLEHIQGQYFANQQQNEQQSMKNSAEKMLGSEKLLKSIERKIFDAKPVHVRKRQPGSHILCPVCNKCFGQNDLLAAHMKHHV